MPKLNIANGRRATPCGGTALVFAIPWGVIPWGVAPRLDAVPEGERQDEPQTQEVADEEMTAEQLAEAKQYGRLDLYCDLADRAIDVAYLAIMALVAAVAIDQWLQRFPPLDAIRTLRLAALFLVVTGVHIVVSFPLSFYSGFVLEHRFGLSRQSLGRWFMRYLKRNALALGFGLAMIAALYWVIWLVGPWWWLVAAVAFFVVSIVLGQLAPVLILPLFYKVDRLDDDELARRLQRRAEGTGLSIQGVYRLGLSEETAKANAALAGLGRTRRVLLGDTLLEKFTPDEIEVIFAHEVGHHVHRHIHKMIAAGALFSLAGFWIADRVLMAYAGPDYTHATLPVWTLPLLMLVITLFSMVLEPLQNAISRHYERQCDRYALETTGMRAAYVSAFRKLARLNKDDPDPHPLEVALFHSHPPISERLAMAGE